MHQYDVASKVLMETCRDDMIRYFAGIDVAKSDLISELPQETVSLKRSDFPVLATDRNGEKNLILFELQTHWKQDTPLNLLDHRTRYQIKMKLDPVSVLILLKPSGRASHIYKNSEVQFAFRLIKIYDMDAREILDHGPLCLLPFTPLMNHGPELLDQADNLIYQSERTRIDKANMLTSLAILSGIVSNDLPVQLINRRKDIMIESAAYDIIKQDGIQEGIQQGIQQGINEGMILDAREMIKEVITTRFKHVPEDISIIIERVSDRTVLKKWLTQAIECESLEALRVRLRKTEQ